jgi:hypothetical protein
MAGNDFRQPQPGDILYNDDRIALVPAGVVYGITVNNSSHTHGGDGIDIAGNALWGCTAGSILGIAFRNGKICGNDIRQPGNSTFSPILLGNAGASITARAYANSITGNRIHWSPAVPKPAIVEAEDWGAGPLPWNALDVNWVEGNHTFDPLSHCFEFRKALSSSSTTRRRISSEASNLSNPDQSELVRLSTAAGLDGYLSFLTKDATEVFRVADTGVADLRGAIYAAFRLFMGATQEAIWSAGAIAAFDVLNNAATHVFTILQTGVAQLRGPTAGALELFAAAVRESTWSADAANAFDVYSSAGIHVLTVLQNGDISFQAGFTWNHATGTLTLSGDLLCQNVAAAVGMTIAGLPVATRAYADAGDAALNAAKANHGTYPVVAGAVTI